MLETSRLWRSVVNRLVPDEFPGVTVEHMFIDAATMHVLRRPADFDVIVTENMFGDILTDEVAMLPGSLGLCPSASIGDGTRGLYEPIHGSAPDIAGKGIANPCGTILSAAMLLRHSLGLEPEAAAIEAAVAAAIEAGVLTPDLAPRGRRPRRPARSATRCWPGCADSPAALAPAVMGRPGISSGPVQPRAQVLDQVLDRLDADRQSQQPRRDARLATRGRFHGGVGHGVRMRDQALDAAERLRQRETLQSVEEACDRRQAAAQLEADDRPVAGLLSRGQFVARVGREARVEDPRDGPVTLEQCCDPGRVLAVLAEPAHAGCAVRAASGMRRRRCR